jgi:hypothetical protein
VCSAFPSHPGIKAAVDGSSRINFEKKATIRCRMAAYMIKRESGVRISIIIPDIVGITRYEEDKLLCVYKQKILAVDLFTLVIASARQFEFTIIKSLVTPI